MKTLLKITNYKGHTIEKMKGTQVNYYTVDGQGYFIYMKYAKSFIDNQITL